MVKAYRVVSRFQTRCEVCGVILRYEDEDITANPTNHKEVVKCPRCGSFTHHYKKNLYESKEEEIR